MCKIGDIIVVSDYVSNGVKLSRHSFVVLSTDKGQIQGLDYDLVCNVISSFHSEEQKARKLSYPGNFGYDASQENIKNGHGKSGYIKAEQFYYFDSAKTNFYVIGSVTEELFNSLLAFIQGLESIDHIIDNL